MNMGQSRSARRGWIPISVAILMFMLATGAFALNTVVPVAGDRAGIRNRASAGELAREKKLIWEDDKGHRVYRVSAKGLSADEVSALVAAGEVQWCWKRSCEHWMIECDGGTSTDVDGCSVRCSWSGTSTTVTVYCDSREATLE